MEDLRVLYILGMPRSGTTIAGRLLGSIPGWTFAGAVRRTWDPGLTERTRCGCGASEVECPVWSKLLEPGSRFMGHDPEELRVMAAVAAPRNHSTLAAARIATFGVDRSAEARRYLDVLGGLYKAFAEVTGARVVVDASKKPADALLLPHLDGIRSAVVEIVRDPRGVVHSHMRRASRPMHGVQGFLRAGRLAMGWDIRGLGSALVRRRFGTAAAIVRYEDLVTDPDAVASLACRLLQLPQPQRALAPGHVITLPTSHAKSGGGTQIGGQVVIKDERAWVKGLPAAARWSVTAMTVPRLIARGYPVGTPRGVRTGRR
jgi:hypothetical protein